MKLADTSPMPFGKHRGIPMQDVPVDYLFWLWNNGMATDKNSDVANYIRDNLDALKMEKPDAIWE